MKMLSLLTGERILAVRRNDRASEGENAALELLIVDFYLNFRITFLENIKIFINNINIYCLHTLSIVL